MRLRHLTAKCGVLVAMLHGVFPSSALPQETGVDLTALSLERLLDVQVSSVSRHLEELRKTAAAVYVITEEDIRRSGVTDIADLLRTVPGIDVAQINGSSWAVSVRGFNAQYAKKVLVLVDGRTVYDPATSGVSWQLQNLVVEDIDRIEVIRGPGATMWGANAVNGVISITTKQASSTKGGLLAVDAGSNRPGEGSARFGGSIGKNAFYRAYGRQTTRSSPSAIAGHQGGAWNLTSSGFRLDWAPSTRDSFAFEVGAQRGVIGSQLPSLVSMSPVSFDKAGVLRNTSEYAQARWTRSFGDTSNLELHFYYDQSHQGGFATKDVRLVDLDLQHSFNVAGRHEVIWGIGHRETQMEFLNTLGFRMNSEQATDSLSSGFVQDEISLTQQLHLTVGSKFERSSLNGLNMQPSIRALWLPTSRHSVWASVARAVRTPSASERGMRKPLAAIPMGSSFGFKTLMGTETVRSEQVTAYDTGYRYQANRKLWLDTAAFYNNYDNLISMEPGTPFFETEPAPRHLVLPVYWGNNVRGKTYGAEFAATYKVNDFWTIQGSYSSLRMRLRAYPGSLAPARDTEGQSPQNQVYIGSSVTLPKSLEMSTRTYFVGRLPSLQIPSYVRFDVNLGWKAHHNFEVNVLGQNLAGSHIEFKSESGAPVTAIERSVQARIKWRF